MLRTAARLCLEAGRPLRRCCRRTLVTLAVETSCDDTSVAVLEAPGRAGPDAAAKLLFHEKVTSDSSEHKGIHPLVALRSHQQSLAILVGEAVTKGCSPRRPDFVTVTRGPGMRANLNAGLDLAKGLSVAWQVPLVAVNHMQAHALTPRLVSALAGRDALSPSFPFLSLLVSGGHTMLIHSKSLTEHSMLAATCDIAVGDYIDKVARVVVPRDVLAASGSSMYGPVLESFAFGSAQQDLSSTESHCQQLEPHESRHGWALHPPYASTRQRAMEFSFSGLGTQVDRISKTLDPEADLDKRRDLAQAAMRVAFEHLASRVTLGLQQAAKQDNDSINEITDLVVSGGVAANRYLRRILRSCLDARGFGHINPVFPPPELCTDNAAMIAWTGIEMYQAGWSSTLDVQSLRKWSLDPDADDGGILGVPGWQYTAPS